jgi:ferredoxin
MHKLKKARIIISLVFFALFTWAFLAIAGQNEYFTHTIAALQLIPAFLELIVTFLAGGGSGFVLIIILTFLFGRVYCSFLCPLGVVQDIFINIKSRVQSPGDRGKYEKPLSTLHYVVTAAVFAAFAAGSAVLLGALEPFANFGRIISDLLKPAFVYANNWITYAMSAHNINITRPMQTHYSSAGVMAYTAGFFVFIAAMSLLKGRLYCNTLCPAGGVLSLLARASRNKIQFNEEKCNNCGLCELVCKANCIDSANRTIDFSRCINCMNCIDSCRQGAVGYARGVKNSAGYDRDRREAIKALGIAGAGLGLAMLPGNISASLDSGLAPQKRPKLVLPPGAKSLQRLDSKCISCNLCVTSCPSRVITPAFMEAGTAGFLQPRLDYDVSYCNYKCNVCSQVCPTGALMPLSVIEKKVTKIGESRFVEKNCIVHTKKTECLVCNEYCPTKAVELVPYRHYNLKIPRINRDICIGCGACEHVCPARPKKAIYVEGFNEHKRAKSPAAVKAKWKGKKEFPF